MLRAFALTGGRSPPSESGVGGVRQTRSVPAAPFETSLSRLSGLVAFALLLIALLSAAAPAQAFEAFQNGRLRFGTGSEASVNSLGNLQQPFYYDSVLGGGGWYKLTYSSYPLDNAIGVGGDGASNWNLNGSITQNPALTGQVLDVSSFVRVVGSNGYGTIVSTGDVTVGGQTFQIRTTYSLGQTDSFVRIITRVTNTGVSPLQNLRVWVGTRDDWVGTTDSPTKRRGNLVGTSFVNLSNAADRSAALQISSGATGVLFFSTSPRAYTSINSCCSFSNSYQQNPATSAITLTNDGSYALFVRMNDLGAGQSDEFTWYYAAGEIANLGQIIAAVSAASAISLPVNVPVTPFIPVTSSGGTGTLTYAISPALPAGLLFNTANGQISGTPLVVSPSTVYTVTITDSIPSSTSATFSMSVISAGATTLSITTSASLAAYAAPMTVQARLKGTTPTGAVDFTVIYNSGADTAIVTVCKAVALVDAAAECIVPGEYQRYNPVYYHVAYSGDANNPATIASFMQPVQLARTTLTATVSPQRPVAGRSAVISALAVKRGLEGAVSFNENGLPLPGCGAVTLASVGGSTDAGVASCKVDGLTAGDHAFVVTLPNSTGPGFEQVVLNVAVAASGPVDYTDLWWGGAAENGWGLSVSQHGGTQFVVLYVYDNAGNPTWYAMPGGSWNGTANTYSGMLYQPTSTPYTAYDASKFSANVPVGSATIAYTTDSTAVLTYLINGIAGTKQVTRQSYPGDDGRSAPAVNDIWWAGSKETGWGLSIDQHGRTLFPVWYTYDAAGKATWFAVPGGTWNGTTFTGDVYRATGSAWLGATYDASAFRAAKVGSMSLTFVDQETAMMTCTMNGVSHTDTIVRQAY